MSEHPSITNILHLLHCLNCSSTRIKAYKLSNYISQSALEKFSQLESAFLTILQGFEWTKDDSLSLCRTSSSPSSWRLTQVDTQKMLHAHIMHMKQACSAVCVREKLFLLADLKLAVSRTVPATGFLLLSPCIFVRLKSFYWWWLETWATQFKNKIFWMTRLAYQSSIISCVLLSQCWCQTSVYPAALF